MIKRFSYKMNGLEPMSGSQKLGGQPPVTLVRQTLAAEKAGAGEILPGQQPTGIPGI
jgi:hypothetical protein